MNDPLLTQRHPRKKGIIRVINTQHIKKRKMTMVRKIATYIYAIYQYKQPKPSLQFAQVVTALFNYKLMKTNR